MCITASQLFPTYAKNSDQGSYDRIDHLETH